MEPLKDAEVMLIKLARCWAVIDLKADLPQRDGKTFSASVRAWANKCWHVSTNLNGKNGEGMDMSTHDQQEGDKRFFWCLWLHPERPS